MLAYWRESYRKMPRPIRRLHWWWLLPPAGIALFFGIEVMSICTPYAPLRWLGPFESASVLVFQFVTMGITIFKTRAVRRAFNASGGRLCTECGHSLAGLADKGRCPECGREFETARDRKVWKDAGVVLEK